VGGTDPAQRALENGRPEKAAEYAKNALFRNPKDPAGYLLLGASYEAQGFRPRAQSVYRECISHAEGPRVSECRDLIDRQ
jgi:predicted Zn-dependent protease